MSRVDVRSGIGGSLRAGIDTGVFLIRNHPFIRDLLNTLEKQARLMPLPASQVPCYAVVPTFCCLRYH